MDHIIEIDPPVLKREGKTPDILQPSQEMENEELQSIIDIGPTSFLDECEKTLQRWEENGKSPNLPAKDTKICVISEIFSRGVSLRHLQLDYPEGWKVMIEKKPGFGEIRNKQKKKEGEDPKKGSQRDKTLKESRQED